MIEMSFSQANTYLRCKRAWAFDKVDKLRGLPSLAAIRGTRYHSAIEECVNSETNSSSRIVTNALDIVAEFVDPEPEVYLELSTDIFTGKADLLDIKVRGYADIIGFRGDEKTIVDWKFPGKHPGKTPKPNYVDQLQLYGYIANAKNLMVVFPEHDKAFTFPVDSQHGIKVFHRLVNVAKDIFDTDALNTPGMETEPTPNYLCAKHCNYRAVCPLGGNDD